MHRLTVIGLALSMASLAAIGTPATQVVAQPMPLTELIKFTISKLNEYWDYQFSSGEFAKRPETYARPRAMALTVSLRPCGSASPMDGPFYCPSDETVYLDTAFLGKLDQGVGDFGVAYGIAHEWAHHVQSLLGIVPKNSAREKGQHYGYEHELQADCLAGMWARYMQAYLEPGDLEEAVLVAVNLGDPTHGSGRGRMDAFMRGFRHSSALECGIW